MYELRKNEEKRHGHMSHRNAIYFRL